MRYSTAKNTRPLNINFDAYSDGEDEEFKRELLKLMKGSVLELQVAAGESYSVRNAEIFKRAAHKAKSTLILINDQELIASVDDFKQHLIEVTDGLMNELNPAKKDKLNELCDCIVESLEKEADRLQSP